MTDVMLATQTGPNLLTPEQSSFEGGTVGGWADYQNVTVANSTAQAQDGTHCLQMTATAAATGTVWYTGSGPYGIDLGVTPAASYQISAWMRAATHGQACTFTVWFYNAAGTYISAGTAHAADTTTGWTQLTAVIPTAVGARYLQPLIGPDTMGLVGEVHYIDQIFLGQVIPITGAVSLTGETLCKFGDSGYVKLILQGGPLDGEQQIVLDISRTPGYPIVFNVPNSQTFAPDGVTLIDLGLQVTYTVATQGPPPDVGSGDTWDTSWFLNFVPESYTPRPPPITPPLVPPDYAAPAVWMGVNSGMIVNADNPSAGVWMLDTQADLDIEGTSLSVDWATVGLVAVTTLIAEGTVPPPEIVLLQATTRLTVGAVTYPNVVVMGATTTLTIQSTTIPTGSVFMGATSGMNVTGIVPVNVLNPEDQSFEGGTTGDWGAGLNCTVANSTVQAEAGTHSLALTATAAATMYAVLPPSGFTGPQVTVGATYIFICGFRPGTTVRSVAAYIQWYNATGTNINQSGTLVSEIAGQWVNVVTTAVAPAGAVTVVLQPTIFNAALNEVHYIDKITFSS